MNVWRDAQRGREDAERRAELEPWAEVVIPLTGELVALGEPAQVAGALDHIRELKRALDEVRVVLEDALRIESERQGTKTLHLDGWTATLSGGEKAEYDILKLGELLFDEGLPASRLAELVVQTVTYKVDQRVARSVAAANPRYALALEACKTVVPAPWRVTVKKGPADERS